MGKPARIGGENFGGEGGPVDWMYPGGIPATPGDPEAHKRTDAVILQNVQEELRQDPGMAENEIQAIVRDGEVTLTGIVPNRHLKGAAEDLADAVPGVTFVHNEIQVRSGGAAWPPER